MAAFYVGLAFLSYVVRWFAVVPPILIMLIWSIGLKVRIRRRYWFPIVSELVIAASMIAWIIVEPTRAYVVPAVVALLALLPFRTSSDPFADAAEQLRFAESPYRG